MEDIGLSYSKIKKTIQLAFEIERRFSIANEGYGEMFKMLQDRWSKSIYPLCLSKNQRESGFSEKIIEN